MRTNFYLENFKGRRHLADRGVNDRKLFILIYDKQDLGWAGYDFVTAGF
jgi:hypothetical protein